MTLHYEDAGLRLFHGSNKDVLGADALGYPFELGYHPDRLIPDASFDSICTDPPYELGFMGKGWDSTGIAYDIDMWRECLRVLKPGGYLLSFGGTRTWHRIAVAIEDAGFEVRDSIAWMYGSGFPKSMNVAKAIASGTGRPEDIRRLSMGDDYTPSGRGRVNYDHGGGSVMNGAPVVDVDLPDAAKPWEGWGTALKPAFEPIIVARKPLVGTVAANVLAYGTGAINIDVCRVAYQSEADAAQAAVPQPVFGTKDEGLGTYNYRAGTGRNGATHDVSKGRFPSNVLLDESQAAVLDGQSGVLRSGTMRAGTRRQARGGSIYGKDSENVVSGDTYGDSGGASRFFPTFRYEAKAPGSERPEVDGLAHATSTLIEYEEAHLPLILARVRKPLQPSMFGDWEAEAS